MRTSLGTMTPNKQFVNSLGLFLSPICNTNAKLPPHLVNGLLPTERAVKLNTLDRLRNTDQVESFELWLFNVGTTVRRWHHRWTLANFNALGDF